MMSVKTLLPVLALVLATGAASAQSVSPGDAQLAASAGMAPGAYSRAVLVQLVEARRDNDAAAVAFLLTQTGPDASRSDFSASSPADLSGLSLAEQIQLTEARRDNDANAVAFILSGANRATPAPAAVVTPGEVQLAAAAGVDPAEYTLAELLELQPNFAD